MPKKIPKRQCLGCREMKEKGQLLRTVRSPQGDVTFDPVGKKPGRGAYVCRNTECLKRALKSKALTRAFGAEIPPAVFEELTRQMENGDGL